MSDISRKDLIKLLQDFSRMQSNSYVFLNYNETQQKLADEILKLQSKEKDIPKEWEILSFVDHCTIMADGSKRTIEYNNSSAQSKQGWVDRWLDANFKIHSVKRISDQITFTIGDNTDFGKIIKFEVTQEGSLSIITPHATMFSLNNIQKVEPKNPLFTTEDGVQIFENDSFWNIDEDYIIDYIHCVQKEWNESWGKTFSCKEKAKEWLTLNMPIRIAYNELSAIFNEHEIYPICNFKNKLKEFFKSKIQ